MIPLLELASRKPGLPSERLRAAALELGAGEPEVAAALAAFRVLLMGRDPDEWAGRLDEYLQRPVDSTPELLARRQRDVTAMTRTVGSEPSLWRGLDTRPVSG